MKRRPIFVIGIARSGTNLLARMLDRHPSVCIALDPLMPVFRALRNAIVRTAAPQDVWNRFKPESPFLDYYFDRDGPAILDMLLQGDASLPLEAGELPRLRHAARDRAALESPDLAARLVGMEGGTYAELIESALQIIASMKPAAAWVGCKEVWIFDFVPLLARAFPDARLYAIERDPRAIVASLLAMAKRDPTQAAHPPSYMRHWRKSIALSRAFEADPYLRSRFRTISYEMLVADPETEGRRLCAELGIEYDAAMLSLSAEGWTGNSSYAEGRDVYVSSVERWRKTLPAEVIRTVDFLCEPEMALTPYRPEPESASVSAVKEYLRRTGSERASWKSSSGNPITDFEGEVARHELLAMPGTADAGEIRRHFLFRETFEAIRRARSRKASGAGARMP